MTSALNALDLGSKSGKLYPGLVPVHGQRARLSVDEEAAVRSAAAIDKIDFVFFRRFSDGRSSQVAAYVIDNHDSRLSEHELAAIHQKLWWKLEYTLPSIFTNKSEYFLSCAGNTASRSKWEFCPRLTYSAK